MKKDGTPFFDDLDETFRKKEIPSSENIAQSRISDSGNSNVDVHITIDVDVKSIAFAMLYSLFAKKELTESQLEDALKRLADY